MLPTNAALASGARTFSVTLQTPGSVTVAAADVSDNTKPGSTSPAITVNPADTSTTVASSANPSVFGQSVTFTASVAAVAPASGTPTGTVTFQDGVTTLGTGTLSAGQATFVTSGLSVAAHAITAVYGGDTSFNPSTSSTLTQTVDQSATSVAVTSSANPSVAGQSVTLTATVSPVAPGSGTPEGIVTFKDGAATLGTGTLSSGQATWIGSSLSVAAHSITAEYGGDTDFNPSTSSVLSQTVNKDSSSVELSSSPNPSVFGQAVTFTATVSAVAPGSGTSTGTVQFMTNGVNFGSAVSLSGGSASSETVSSLTAGSPTTVIAVYSGDSDFNPNTSSDLTQTIHPAGSSVAWSLRRMRRCMARRWCSPPA